MFSPSTPPLLLETKRLYLRELTPALYKELFTTQRKPAIMAYLGLHTDQEYKEAEIRFTKGATTFFSTFKLFHLLDKASHQVIGRCDYHTWVPTHRRAEVGYVITSEAFKNRGLMAEALEAVLACGYEHMNLYRVEAMVSPKNTPSMQLLQHFGFKKEGLLRNHYMVEDVLEDSVVYSLLKPEFADWQQQHPKAV
ncbi:GNAT family N-acetyltransferase [Pontibacter liquoris]|uniref:GNAT family N-acetyltransferase n=1 Tax=Pontibacter liquoris TaxID=2905677 RepID=UPI001FA7FC9B|nr:GNAT family protein [Pontibacter liquoris]